MSETTSNADIALILHRIATMLEIEAANPFRVRAYREAARVLDSVAEPVAPLVEEAGRLERLPGIGKDLAAKIREIVRTGTTAVYEEIKARVPIEAAAMTSLQNMGPKRVKTLLERGITSLDALEEAAKAGQLRTLPGFGEVLQKKLIGAIEAARQESKRVLLHEAWPVAHAIAERVRQVEGVAQVEIAGSFRRRCDTVGDLDLLVSGGAADAVMSAFTRYYEVAEIRGKGASKSSVVLASGLQVDLRLVPPESFGAAMLYFTGSKAHNIELRRIALDQGWSLNEYGLNDQARAIAGRTEEEVYRALGMEWIPPELREGRGEIQLAREGRLPRLIEVGDLRADLHMHTDRTDGRESLETMVRAARDKGYAYCAITDHSKSLTMLSGFDTARVRQSVDEIAAVREMVPGIAVLHGLEVDILEGGELDLDEEGLAMLDWVIVSLHSRLSQPRAEMTARVLKALSHPAVHVMGHPTARMLGRRAPADLDMEAVLDRAARHGVMMEINAQPHRTDLNDHHARMAKERGVKLVINTDAHRIKELDYMPYGVFAARRAGLTKEDVLNTLPYDDFRSALADRRSRSVRS